MSPHVVGCRDFLIRGCIYQGGSDSTDRSNYRAPEANGPDRHRELERDCLEISVTPSRSRLLCLGAFRIRVSIYPLGSFRLIHRIIGRQRKNAPDRQRGLEPHCLEISVISCLTVPLVCAICLISVGIYQVVSSAPDTSIYTMPRGNWPDRRRGLGIGRLEISFTACLPMWLGFGIVLIRVIIYQGVFFRPACRIIGRHGEKRPRSTAAKGTRLSGISDISVAPCH